jgi:hypothetical protein
MGENGFSLPITLIIAILIAALAVLFGWHVLLYVLVIFVATTLGVALYDLITHQRTCKQCIAAKEHIKTMHPEWEVWTTYRSHRAKEAERMVIAVFYRVPDRTSMPTPYRLISVTYDLREVYELDQEEQSAYRIRNYK